MAAASIRASASASAADGVATARIWALPPELLTLIACSLRPEDLCSLKSTCRHARHLLDGDDAAEAWVLALSRCFTLPSALRQRLLLRPAPAPPPSPAHHPSHRRSWRDVHLSLRLTQPVARWHHLSQGTRVREADPNGAPGSTYDVVLHMNSTTQRTLQVR